MKIPVKNCIVCGKEYMGRRESQKYCSRGCRMDNFSRCNIGRTNSNGFKKGVPAWNKGLPRTWESPGDFKKGHISWITGKKGIHQSPGSEFKKGNVRPKSWMDSQRKKTSGDNNSSKRPEVREKIRQANLGEKSHFWRGGVSKENYRLRRTAKYKLWRKSVFERDNYTCQKCGKRGGRIQAHHKKSWENYPDFRFRVSNGQTLCLPCHTRTGTYAKNLKNKGRT